MKIKTNIKSGGMDVQHNQTVVGNVRVKSGVKSGSGEVDKLGANHSQTISCGSKVETRRLLNDLNKTTLSGLRVNTNLKAGALTLNHNQKLSQRRLPVKSI